MGHTDSVAHDPPLLRRTSPAPPGRKGTGSGVVRILLSKVMKGREDQCCIF
jgi:hypothetical protein